VPYTRYTEANADQYVGFAEKVQQWVLSQLPSTP
jgi:hypothetical protein